MTIRPPTVRQSIKLFKKVLDNGKHVNDPNVVSQKFESLTIKSNKKMNINLYFIQG